MTTSRSGRSGSRDSKAKSVPCGRENVKRFERAGERVEAAFVAARRDDAFFAAG
jgi:hypothetical protein